jgi:hypothetical protein
MEFSKATQLQTFLSIFRDAERKKLKCVISKYLLFSLNFPSEEPRARKEAIKELVQKQLNNSILDSFFNQKIVLKREPQRRIEFKKDGVKFICGQLHYFISSDLYDTPLLSRIKDDDIFELLFRYNFMWGSPYLWSIDEHIHETLVNNFNLTLECFATPLERRIPRFLSLFEEDKKFGALGNFFSFPLEGEVCLVNPPFIPFIFEKMIPILKRKDGTFFVFLPMWEDDLNIQEIRKMACSEVRFEKGTYRLFTMDNKIVSKIDVLLVCISSQKVDLHPAF